MGETDERLEVYDEGLVERTIRRQVMGVDTLRRWVLVCGWDRGATQGGGYISRDSNLKEIDVEQNGIGRRVRYRNSKDESSGWTGEGKLLRWVEGCGKGKPSVLIEIAGSYVVEKDYDQFHFDD